MGIFVGYQEQQLRGWKIYLPDSYEFIITAHVHFENEKYNKNYVEESPEKPMDETKKRKKTSESGEHDKARLDDLSRYCPPKKLQKISEERNKTSSTSAHPKTRESSSAQSDRLSETLTEAWSENEKQGEGRAREQSVKNRMSANSNTKKLGKGRASDPVEPEPDPEFDHHCLGPEGWEEQSEAIIPIVTSRLRATPKSPDRPRCDNHSDNLSSVSDSYVDVEGVWGTRRFNHGELDAVNECTSSSHQPGSREYGRFSHTTSAGVASTEVKSELEISLPDSATF